MAISEEFLSELRDRTDIEDLLSSYMTLKRRGKTLVGLCPFHSEKTPSFTAYPENNSFYCFGCGAGGDVVTFVRRMENLDYLEAVKFLAQRAGLRMPEDGFDDTLSKRRQRILSANREAAKFYHACLMQPENAHALNYYLEKRGLTMATVRHFGLGYAPDKWDALLRHMQQKGYTTAELLDANLIRQSSKSQSYYDNFRNRVITPIIDVRSNVIAFGGRVLDDSKPKYVNTSDTLVYKKSREVFALNFAKNANERRLIMCEGYMDVIALHQAGFTYAVAGCGTALTHEQARLLSRYADEVLLCYDADEAGQTALRKAISIFSSVGMKIKVIRLSGGKDPDEILRKYGKDRFRALLDGAANDIEFRILAEREKYDLESDDGKVRFLGAVIDLLAAVENSIERDVYVSRLATELSVDKSAVQAQIDHAKKTLRRRRNREQMQELSRTLTQTKDTLNPEQRDHYRAAKAEQAILTLLLHNNDFIEAVRRVLSPEDFVTSLYAHIYTQFLACFDEAGVVDLMHLSAYFDPEEMSRVTRLDRNGALYLNTLEECLDCVHTLLQEKQKLRQPDDTLDDDASFLNSFKQLKENKQ